MGIKTTNLIHDLVRAALKDGVGSLSQGGRVLPEAPADKDTSPCSSIHRLFGEWLSLTPQEQKAELDAYVLAGPYEPTWVVDWLAEHYHALTPPDASDLERRLFLSGFGALIKALQRQFSHPSCGAESGPVVLVVEDDFAVLQLMRRVLAANGYAVLAARNAERGLRAFMAHAESIAVVIADVVVPGMKTGDMAQEILRVRPDVAILFVSGYGDDVVARCISIPTVELLRKPFSPCDLLHFVGTALSRRGARTASHL